MTEINSLLKEAENVGILNIDVNNDQLSPEVVQTAINATIRLNSKLEKDIIEKKLREADRVVAAQHR
jgi:hypothetical protein